MTKVVDQSNNPEKVQEIFKDCDGIVWGLQQETVLISAFRVTDSKKKKPKPHELGFKYNILTFKQGDNSTIDIFEAIIGDPEYYATNLANVGYAGFMLKSKYLSKREVNKTFKSILMNYGFEESVVTKILSRFK